MWWPLLLACSDPDPPTTGGTAPTPTPEPSCASTTGPEVCNGADDDCDGLVDDADPDLDPTSATAWFWDNDGDGHGNPEREQRTCEAQQGRVADGTDCDDGDERAFPGAAETCGDGADQDCDGADPACPLVLQGDIGLSQLTIRVTGGSASFGQAVARGDLDGDGADELVIGDPLGQALPGQRGAISAVPLPLAGAVRVDVARTWWMQSQGFTELGDDLAVADVTGDQVDDVIASWWGLDDAATHVWAGPLVGQATEASATTTIGLLSRPIADDLDGDGVADLLLRYDLYERVPRAPGHLLPGPLPGGTVYPHQLLDLEFEAVTPIRTGDLDGDGVADVVVTFGDHRLALALAPLDDLDLPSSYSAVLATPSTDLAPTSVAPPADVDGDGVADLVAGYGFPLGSRPGETLLWLDPLHASAPASTLAGPTDSRHHGASVATADLDDDGLSEVVTVGSSAADPTTLAALLFMDTPAGAVDAWAGATARALVPGANLPFSPGDQTFLEVSGLGDLTGDGVDDVLLGGRLGGEVVVLPGVP